MNYREQREQRECLDRLGQELASIAKELRERRPDPSREDLPAAWRPFEFPDELGDLETPSRSDWQRLGRAWREHQARRDPLDGARLIAEHIRAAILDCMNFGEPGVCASAGGILEAAKDALDEAIWTAELERGELGQGEEKATTAIVVGFANATRLAADDLQKMAARLRFAGRAAATNAKDPITTQAAELTASPGPEAPADLISQTLAARLKKVDKSTIKRAVREKKLKGYGKVGQQKVSRREVDNWQPRRVSKNPARQEIPGA